MSQLVPSLQIGMLYALLHSAMNGSYTCSLNPLPKSARMSCATPIGYLFTYFAPLLFVLAVTMTKEAMDDYKRYQRDQEANSQRFERLVTAGESAKVMPSNKTSSRFVEIPGSQIRVGDILRVHKDQRVPADMVLLRTSERSGGCFIRTDQVGYWSAYIWARVRTDLDSPFTIHSVKA